uniref:Uncharacterized protein n=1 Tax=Arundo donax TaxID=35708 RepID=A0A0A8ZT13_ARUDO
MSLSIFVTSSPMLPCPVQHAQLVSSAAVLESGGGRTRGSKLTPASHASCLSSLAYNYLVYIWLFNLIGCMAASSLFHHCRILGESLYVALPR